MFTNQAYKPYKPCLRNSKLMAESGLGDCMCDSQAEMECEFNSRTIVCEQSKSH